MSFSNGSGGTLALPSPTHGHHMDVTSAVRSLRRSISRSPSKFLSRTSSRGTDGSQQASPQSPCRRFGSTPQRPHLSPSHPQTAPPAITSTHATSPHQSSTFTPLRPSVRLSLRSAKSARASSPSSRPLARARASPKSPLKRALSAAPDSGNTARSSSPSPTATASPGQENCSGGSLGSTPRKNLEKPARHSVHLDVSGAASQYSFLKALDANSESYMVSTTGALKRSDASMNLDHPNQGSPVAKRRSLHGISSLSQSEDLNIFGSNTSASQSFDIHEDSQSEYELIGASGSNDDAAESQRDPLASPTPASSLPKRSSSLRKSTLQQRYGDKGSWGRRTGERQLAQMSAEASTPARNRPRLSTDHFLPPQVPRDSPFSSGIPLPSASVHPIEAKGHQPHPLSKTLTTSSSGNSLTEETLAYAPVAKVADKPKPHPFSRSLPLNATRPTSRPMNEHTKAVATPSQSHRLWIGAFNSTGLISKVNRNPEEEAETRIAPPDTPCKKHSNPFATFPPPAGSAIKRKNNNRNSFAGISSTPFSRPVTRAPDTFGLPGKGLSIFQRGSAARNSRRSSVLSLEGEDRMLFGEAGEFSNPLDGDIPPTPTKNTLTPSLSNLSEQSLESPSANRTFTLPLSAVKPAPSRESTCKSTPDAPCESMDRDDEARTPSASRPATLHREPSPTPCLAPRPSFSRSRIHRGIIAPSPLAPQPSLLSVLRSENAFTKFASVDPASPVDGRRTPQTPQESLLPLDTSRLSISQAPDGLGENGMPPPVTPTAGRDFRSSTSIFVTPVNGRTSNLDIDASLYSRFDKVERVGKGEFSTVYRVTKLEHPNAFAMGNVTPSNDATRSPAKGQVFAVKKSRYSYHGPKDREIKLREVQTLQALTHAEHVVQYVDSWEHNFHLYIQTEFCEEGTLDRFLGNVGRGGRLDDFRIFKILQDLCLGLKEVHDAGFMHLDMKPANILIGFEGALKIGDFGLAQPCSSTEGVDMEGDREYMAPEMLRGKAGQAADVFSLGLMTLETAANVVLPDNGPTWIALRSGDLSEVPSLTWTPSIEVQRDATGNPSVHSDDLQGESRSAGNLFGSFKRSEAQQPPDFMVEAFHPSSLDSIVRWMTAESPTDRPLVDQVLDLEGLRWVADHRNAPATVYEGNWGPAELFPVSIAGDSDTEMTDV
ncbi:Mitosis inhibitor protein kinase wee1 [Tolypocladium ophioglossoides CBS 100239]|uniref:Mitosis inhibitor protein kinase wee1 n=1 Tax=Tolypocladium ophioglossoides (strain CBS 100239) TaxID=1163406 RepID=A0A0L0MWY5_TOLOC|nr:Mitosis inhibitor protein kinase wee1 [Tolypocladium ophioglossoides CBS 100239]